MRHPNILIDIAIEGIKRWTHIEKNINIPDEFIYAIKFILSSTYFIFNKTIYKQTYEYEQTIEYEQNRCLSFLDLWLEMKDDTIFID